jgi:hypothetical protein
MSTFKTSNAACVRRDVQCHNVSNLVRGINEGFSNSFRGASGAPGAPNIINIDFIDIRKRPHPRVSVVAHESAIEIAVHVGSPGMNSKFGADRSAGLSRCIHARPILDNDRRQGKNP